MLKLKLQYFGHLMKNMTEQLHFYFFLFGTRTLN